MYILEMNGACKKKAKYLASTSFSKHCARWYKLCSTFCSILENLVDTFDFKKYTGGEIVKPLWFYTRIEQLNVRQELPLGRKLHIKKRCPMWQRRRDGNHGDTDDYVKKYLQVFVHTCVLAVE